MSVRLRAVLVFIAVVALALLIGRGVLPAVSFSGDLTMIHAGARLWWQGGNPYDFEALYTAYEQAGGQGERLKDAKWFVALYPPTTYAVLGPLGALSWPTGRVVWLVLSLFSALAIAWWGWKWRPISHQSEILPSRVATQRGPSTELNSADAAVSRTGLRGNPAKQIGINALLLGVLWLAFAPVHTTVKFGQLGLVVLALMVWAIGVPGRAPRPWVAGLLLALAGALKPQLAGVVALGLLAVGRWRDLAWTAGIGLVITAIAIARLEWSAAEPWAWLHDLLSNLDRFAGQGFADPRPENPVAYHMINFDPLTWRLGLLAGWLRPVAWGLLALSVIWAVWRIGKARCGCRGLDEREQPGAVTLWVAALLAVLTLLVAYHRFYDLVLLAIPAVWAWRRWANAPRCYPPNPTAADSCPSRGPALFAAILMLVFMVPIASLLDHLSMRSVFLESLTAVPGWHTVVMHHGTWVLLALWLTLLWAGPNLPPRPVAARPGTATPA